MLFSYFKKTTFGKFQYFQNFFLFKVSVWLQANHSLNFNLFLNIL